MFPRSPPASRRGIIAGIPVSFAICFDLHFDEVFAAARESGAKLVLWSSMWMGGMWLRAQAIRYGIVIVTATPDGCTFVDLDGSTICESPTQWPQTAGSNIQQSRRDRAETLSGANE